MHVNDTANKSLLWWCTFLLQPVFIRTRLRSQWKRNFSKGGSSGALISLTFAVVISAPVGSRVPPARTKRGAAEAASLHSRTFCETLV